MKTILRIDEHGNGLMKFHSDIPFELMTKELYRFLAGLCAYSMTHLVANDPKDDAVLATTRVLYVAMMIAEPDMDRAMAEFENETLRIMRVIDECIGRVEADLERTGS